MNHKKSLNLISRSLWIVVLLITALLLVACDEAGDRLPTLAPTAAALLNPTEEPPAGEPVVEPAVEEPLAEPAEEPGQLEALVDELWVLVSYGDAANPTVVEAGTVISALFTDDGTGPEIGPSTGTVSGSAGCNTYNASYEADAAGDLIIGPAATTRMACEEASMAQEHAFLTALGSSVGYDVTAEGRLEITYNTGDSFETKLIFAPGQTPLENTEWLLVSFGDPEEPQNTPAGSTITAVFVPEGEDAQNGTVGGTAVCNSYSGAYTAQDGQIEIGPLATTLAMCPVGAEEEAAYLSALSAAESYHLFGARLEIAYEGGVLVYTSLNLPLESILWKAVVIGGQPVPEAIEVTALFVPDEEEEDMGTVGGSAGCNNYNAGYELDGEQITIGPAASTRMACPDPAGATEAGYLSALGSAETYSILGDRLEIDTADGVIVYIADRLPLEGTLWELTSLGDISDPQPPVEGSDFSAVFTRQPNAPTGIVAGTTGCNEYNASYAASLNEIKINLPVKTKNEVCAPGLFEQEQQFFLGLNAASQYTILGNVLVIPYDGQVLNFTGTFPIVEEEQALNLTPLDGTFWYLVSIGEQAILPGTEITAQFNINEDGITGQVSGSAGCNSYNAPIGENFTLGPVASSRKFCELPPGVMEQEQAYLAALQTANGYNLAGEQLLINTPSGVMTYSARKPEPSFDQTAELQGATWHMVSYGDQKPVVGAEPTAFFNPDSTVTGITGCNEYSGAYRTEAGNVLAISNLSMTRRACSEELAQQEQAFAVLLQSVSNYLVIETELRMLTADGGVMLFSSIAPAAPIPPTASISGPESATAGETVTFDGRGSQAGSTPIVSYHWDMGDGTQAGGPTVEHAYNSPGTFNVTLTVVDQIGQSSETTSQITVNPVPQAPPTAAIEGPAATTAGQQVSFSAAGSTAGSSPITRYLWNFGDGITAETPEPVASNVYQAPGIYQATVTVVDADRLSDTASMQITVNANFQGTTWILGGALPSTTITVQFGSGILSGFGGCNNYNGAFTGPAEGDSGQITIGPLTTSQMACPEDIMSQEQAYLSQLQTATAWRIDGTTLTLTTTSGTLVFYASSGPVPY